MRFLALLLVLASGMSVAAQSKTDSDRYLDSQWKKFNDYTRDFLDFEKAHQNDLPEYVNASHLEDVARQTCDYVDAIAVLLIIYEEVSVDDQAKIAPLIKKSISHYSDEIGLFINMTNNEIAYAKVPALAVTGDRMKKDLRDVQEKLASVQNSLKP